MVTATGEIVRRISSSPCYTVTIRVFTRRRRERRCTHVSIADSLASQRNRIAAGVAHCSRILRDRLAGRFGGRTGHRLPQRHVGIPAEADYFSARHPHLRRVSACDQRGHDPVRVALGGRLLRVWLDSGILGGCRALDSWPDHPCLRKGVIGDPASLGRQFICHLRAHPFCHPERSEAKPKDLLFNFLARGWKKHEPQKRDVPRSVAEHRRVSTGNSSYGAATGFAASALAFFTGFFAESGRFFPATASASGCVSTVPFSVFGVRIAFALENPPCAATGGRAIALGSCAG